MKLWFIFCKDEILLNKTDDSYSIPCGDCPPIPLKDWNVVHNVAPMQDGTEVKTVRIDDPVTDKEHGDEDTQAELLCAHSRSVSESWKMSRTALLGSEYKVLRCLWLTNETEHRHL